MTAIESAIQKIQPATQAELARRIQVKPQEVNRWVKRGWAAPKHAPAIERETGISVHALIADQATSDASNQANFRSG
jgi:DNA-binding transcriptional regulator YdaS (Cro superfamily)